jgi:uncharacterized membrane protein
VKERFIAGIVVALLIVILGIYLALGEYSSDAKGLQAFNAINMFGVVGVILGIFIAIIMFRRKD